MTTLPGKSAFPENHPLSLGAASTSTTKQVARFLDRADVVFGIGCSFTPTGYGRAIPPGKVIIHSTNDPTAVNKNYKTDHALLGDAKLVLQALIEEVKAQSGGVGRRNDRDVAPEVAALRKEWLDDWMPQLTSDEVPINQYRIIWDLLHNVDRANTIVTHDAGSPPRADRAVLGDGRAAHLHGLGEVDAARVRAGDHDGREAGRAGQAVREHDGRRGHRHGGDGYRDGGAEQDRHTDHRVQQPGNGDRARPTCRIRRRCTNALVQYGDYEKLAAALGAWSMKVEKPDDFVPALKSAIEVTRTGRPALLDCYRQGGVRLLAVPVGGVRRTLPDLLSGLSLLRKRERNHV